MQMDAELKELIDASKKNNRSAQEKLYRKFAKPFFHIALSYCADREAAKEVLQETFIKIFKKLDQYNFDGAFEGWMRRILVNTSIDYHRRNSKMSYYTDINDAKVTDKVE
jgi:RNA polymerase sigma-70 factor (ECF subfamily)